MKQILIVDDDIHIGNMLQEVLTKKKAMACPAPTPARKLCFFFPGTGRI